jgi:hypothetical protein
MVSSSQVLQVRVESNGVDWYRVIFRPADISFDLYMQISSNKRHFQMLKIAQL